MYVVYLRYKKREISSKKNWESKSKLGMLKCRPTLFAKIRSYDLMAFWLGTIINGGDV